MRFLSLGGRPGGSRGKSSLRSWEWWLGAHFPRFWNWRCSADCRYGQIIQRGCERHYTDPHNLCPSCWAVEGILLDKYTHREDCPRQPIYLGHVAKGWWSLWTWRDGLWMWSSELIFAIGGEDNMAQISVMLPILGRFSIGVRVPRAWTKSWVYERREFGIELRGIWPTLLIAHDEVAGDMADYYRRKRAERLLQGQLQSEYQPARASLWPGWRLRVSGVRWARLKNRVLGRHEMHDEVLKLVEPVVVTLPEGDYSGTVTFYRSTVKRARWRARRDEVYGKFESEEVMPWPGKGENSYDCGDDGTKEHTERIGPGRMSEHDLDGQDVAKVIAGTIAKVLKYRARYGSWSWKPEGVGVLRD